MSLLLQQLLPSIYAISTAFSSDYCSNIEFECASHDCISISRRCDGVPHCKDASDEYRCVIIDDKNGTLSVFHVGFNYLPVCSTNMSTAFANLLCKLSGQGYTPTYKTGVKKCGTSSLTDIVVLPRVLYGREVTLGNFPWQIALYSNIAFCGGSIIHTKWVITAGHCVSSGSGFKIRLGTVDKFQGLEMQVSRIIILYFSTPIVMNEYVRLVCLSSQLFYKELLSKGPDVECYVSGWGKTENKLFSGKAPSKLQMPKVHLIDYKKCKEIRRFDIHDTTVCIDNSNPGLPICFGDSGGPLVCRNKYGRFQLLGVTSFGHASCTNDYYPDGYQLVHPCLDWIKSVTGVNFTDFEL